MVLAEHANNVEEVTQANNKRPLRKASSSKKRRDSASVQELGSIIPLFPDDVSLCILARLPRYLQLRRRLICHSWKDAMSLPYKRDCSQVFFTVIDPIRRRRRSIHFPSQFHERLHQFVFTVMGAIGSRLFIQAVESIGDAPARDEQSVEYLMQGVYSFDCLSVKWQESVYDSLPGTAHRMIAVAADMDEGYLYVAGGIYGHENSETQGAARLDIKMRKWEALPDPHVKREGAIGVVMGGLFHVIGGSSCRVLRRTGFSFEWQKSGEIWDPATREWSLVPELWPTEFFRSRFITVARVVALRDRLYALRDRQRGCMFEELLHYDSASKAWMSQGIVPLDVSGRDPYYRKSYKNIVDVQLLKIGEELWVVDWEKSICVAAKLSTLYAHQSPLSWRILPPSFKRSLPIHPGHMEAEGFISKLMSALVGKLGIQRQFSSPYHPQCNGFVESANGQIVKMLTEYVYKQVATSFTPLELVYGKEAVLPVHPQLGALKDAIEMVNPSIDICLLVENAKQFMLEDWQNFEGCLEKEVAVYDGKEFVHLTDFAPDPVTKGKITRRFRNLEESYMHFYSSTICMKHQKGGCNLEPKHIAFLFYLGLLIDTQPRDPPLHSETEQETSEIDAPISFQSVSTFENLDKAEKLEEEPIDLAIEKKEKASQVAKKFVDIEGESKEEFLSLDLETSNQKFLEAPDAFGLCLKRVAKEEHALKDKDFEVRVVELGIEKFGRNIVEPDKIRSDADELQKIELLDEDKFLGRAGGSRATSKYTGHALIHYLPKLDKDVFCAFHSQFLDHRELPMFAIKTLSRFMGFVPLPNNVKRILILEKAAAFRIFGYAPGFH
ncbi:hypothetical protein L7F22_066058 [Adiantum nelumboides]|nr:hypothetical protein [Adiantum nelumboides]